MTRPQLSRHAALLTAAVISAACAQRETPPQRDTAPTDSGPAAPAGTVADTGSLWLLAEAPSGDAVHAADDEAALIVRYGHTNVVRDSIPGAEGESVWGTVLYPTDSLRTLYVYWGDSPAFRKPSDVRTGPYATAWRVWPGVAIGATLAEVEQLNGRAFTLNGFGWDYGGLVANWNGGTLEARWHPKNVDAGGWVGVGFSPGKEVTAVQGEGEFSSALPAMRASEPRVGLITMTVR